MHLNPSSDFMNASVSAILVSPHRIVPQKDKVWPQNRLFSGRPTLHEERAGRRERSGVSPCCSNVRTETATNFHILSKP